MCTQKRCTRPAAGLPENYGFDWLLAMHKWSFVHKFHSGRLNADARNFIPRFSVEDAHDESEIVYPLGILETPGIVSCILDFGLPAKE
jgi:hypothetical protein